MHYAVDLDNEICHGDGDDVVGRYQETIKTALDKTFGA